MVTMAGGTPVYLETLEKDNFKLTAEDVYKRQGLY